VSDLHDTWPKDEPIPTGYEWVRTRADKLGDEATTALLESGRLEAFEYCRKDGSLNLVTTQDWLSEFGPEMLKFGFKRHYYHVGRLEKDDPLYDPFQPQPAYSYGSEWRRLCVRCAPGSVESTGNNSPKRLAILEAVTAIYGSIDRSKSTPVKARDTAIKKWLKDNGRVEVDSRTIRRALRTDSDK
jgi:hypothetical protein